MNTRGVNRRFHQNPAIASFQKHLHLGGGILAYSVEDVIFAFCLSTVCP
jgi:hypothetical protein